MIHCRVKELTDQKFGGAKNVNLKDIERATGLNYITVSRWYKGQVDRIDFPTLAKWCKYFECGAGDLLVYQPEH